LRYKITLMGENAIDSSIEPIKNSLVESLPGFAAVAAGDHFGYDSLCGDTSYRLSFARWCDGVCTSFNGHLRNNALGLIHLAGD